MTYSTNHAPTDFDGDFLRRIDGLFVGMLDDSELARFDSLVKKGLARRGYQGVGGFMDLAKAQAITPRDGA